MEHDKCFVHSTYEFLFEELSQSVPLCVVQAGEQFVDSFRLLRELFGQLPHPLGHVVPHGLLWVASPDTFGDSLPSYLTLAPLAGIHQAVDDLTVSDTIVVNRHECRLPPTNPMDNRQRRKPATHVAATRSSTSGYRRSRVP